MADFTIDREERAQGGGYVHIRALSTTLKNTDGSPATLAQASYWPRTQSGYLWSAASMTAQREGRSAAFSRAAQYAVQESDMLALVEQEARSA
jgi:hypothetical protein